MTPYESCCGMSFFTLPRAHRLHSTRPGGSPRGSPISSAALADAIDAELVEPADESDPERGPESPGDEMRYPNGGGDGDGDMPPARGGLMTLEDAAEAQLQARQQQRRADGYR
ncbi:MAG: hypothetical protein QOD02_5693 [Mycobacterium sp.]|jgi:hypothetical protein|nr:hypothetical protein [Mycobacterium sp.]